MALRTITLTYDLAKQTINSDPDPIRFNAGDTLEFVSRQGPVDVLLLPERFFSAIRYKTGDPPVTVLKAQHFKFCCGVKIGGDIFGFPDDLRYGKEEDPVVPP
jgi:hypothetical protein